jgi:hypothetical protein
VSVTRAFRTARQLERAQEFLDEHRAGGTRAQFAEAVGCPESSVSAIGAALRRSATEIGKTFTCLKIGGVYIYAWAESLRDHKQEHLKRRKNELRALKISIETYEESTREHPDDAALEMQLVTARGRRDIVEAQIRELTGQLHIINTELA